LTGKVNAIDYEASIDNEMMTNSESTYANNGLRKAILLSRYASLMKCIITDSREKKNKCFNAIKKGLLKKISFPKEDKDSNESIKLTVSSNWLKVLKDFTQYFQKESNILQDKILDKEEEILDILVNYCQLNSLYYESQKSEDTCFRHATNMYFQYEYINSNFLKNYSTLIKKATEEVKKRRKQNADVTFYGKLNVPKIGLSDTSSDPNFDEDLHGYWEIYQQTSEDNFLEAITELKELSPAQVLFLLEFQLVEQDNVIQLKYCPHRFYHRYSRNSLKEDQDFSKDTFKKVLQDSKGPVYFNHIESGRAHAFGAMRTPGSSNWCLLDSLAENVIFVKNEELLVYQNNFGGRASVMIIPDNSRQTEILASIP